MSAQHGVLAAYPMQLRMRTTQAGSCHPSRTTQGQQVLDGSAGDPSSSCHSTWMWPPSIGALGVQVSVAVPAPSLSSARMQLQKLPPGSEAQDVQVSSAGLADSLSSSEILSLKLPSVKTASEGSTEQQTSRPMSGLSPHAQDISLGSPQRGLAPSQPFKSKAMATPTAGSVPASSGIVRRPAAGLRPTAQPFIPPPARPLLPSTSAALQLDQQLPSSSQPSCPAAHAESSTLPGALSVAPFLGPPTASRCGQQLQPTARPFIPAGQAAALTAPPARHLLPSTTAALQPDQQLHSSWQPSSPAAHAEPPTLPAASATLLGPCAALQCSSPLRLRVTAPSFVPAGQQRISLAPPACPSIVRPATGAPSLPAPSQAPSSASSIAQKSRPLHSIGFLEITAEAFSSAGQAVVNMPAALPAAGSTLELGLSLPLEPPSLEEAASYAMMVSHSLLDDATYRCCWLFTITCMLKQRL